MRNKKGVGEIVMFFPFAFLCFIIVAGIAIGVNAFYNSEYEFRVAESNALADKITGCFSDKVGFDIYKECNLNKDVIENQHLIYIKDSNGNVVINVGVSDYLQQCSFTGAIGNANYPKCVNASFSYNGKPFYYVIGSNQRIKRVLT